MIYLDLYQPTLNSPDKYGILTECFGLIVLLLSFMLQKLLHIVKQKADSLSVDITLKFTLSALWNLTDESPSTCAIFLNEGGLELFIHILEVGYSASYCE